MWFIFIYLQLSDAMWREAPCGGTVLVQAVARRFIVTKSVPEHMDVIVIENATERLYFIFINITPRRCI